MLGVCRGVQDADGIGERGVPDFYLLMLSSGAWVLWVVRLPRYFLWGVLRLPLDSASLAYAFSSFPFSLVFHSLTRSYVRSRIRAIFPLSPRRFFPFFPCSQLFRAHTIPRLVPYCPPLPHISLPDGGISISSTNRNSTPTNHGGHFPPTPNWSRASVSRKGDAGPLSPRVRREALLALAASSRPVIPSRWGPAASLYSPPHHKLRLLTGGEG
jgi:hypothetical protein